MASAIGLELGVRVGAERMLHDSTPNMDKSRSKSSGNRSAEHSVSRVRVHAVSEHSVAVHVSGEGQEDEHKQHAQTLESIVATPTGYVSTEEAEDASLKHDSSSRSRRAASLMRELDAMVVAEDVAANPRSSKAVRAFYTEQNDMVEAYKEIVRLEEAESAAARDEKEKAEETQNLAVKLAINGSLALTFLLIVLKFFAAIWSGSIAVIASAMDSALDVLSQSTLVLSSRFMRAKDPVRYPIGKSRVENLSVLVFGTIMGLAAVFLLWQSIIVLTDGLENRPDIKIDGVTIGILAFTIVIQSLAWFYCNAVARRGGRGGQAVEAIAQDHGNDVCCNSIGMAAALVAGYQNSLWFFDCTGGILIAIYIFSRWAAVCFEQFQLLLGQSADKQFINQLTFLAATFDSRILKVDTVLAYKLGSKIHAEVHIVLPADMKLREAHDIGEALEMYIERIDDVELAWVHLDFEWQHVAEHNRWNL